MAYFSPEQADELYASHLEVQEKYAALIRRFLTRKYNSNDAKEYAAHGFARRIGTLHRCIRQVFEILPPNREDIPDKEAVTDATIYIQAFMFNVFGCCDNLAWIWVHDQGIRKPDGSPLDRKFVGLMQENKLMRALFSQPFQDYLNSRSRWFTHIKDFRDALAHRIPLFIPPTTVTQENRDEYRRLEAEAAQALEQADLARYDQLMAEQQVLTAFQPWMTHSEYEHGKLSRIGVP